jgi:hypothetical protein
MNGLVEGCDGNSIVFNTMALQIVQVAVIGVTYRAQEKMWGHRIFKRDITINSGQNVIGETLELLRRRAGIADESSKALRVTDMMRRCVMTFMEREVLTNHSTAAWRLGHGNPLAYELLTGSGLAGLIDLSLPVLRKLVLDHKKFVFIPSSTTKQHILTIGDALEPLEYAIVDDMAEDLSRIAEGGFRGEWGGKRKADVVSFAREVGPKVLMGVYRASAFAPAQVFYAHAEFAHEAALVAIADSVHLEHRGFPMLIERADTMCRTYFSSETLERPSLAAFGSANEPYRHLSERATRT